MALITPERLVALKVKVKAECQRRKYTGSVSSYGGTAYDYTVNPASGKTILKEHYEKNAIPLNAITGGINTNGARIIDADEITAMENAVNSLSKIALTASKANSGCAASCTGLCTTGCAGTCTGCSGSCEGDCDGGCDGCSGCGSGCADSCSGSCDQSCSGDCTRDCGMTCYDNCYNSCEGSCIDGCHTSCGNDCWSVSGASAYLASGFTFGSLGDDFN